MPGSSCWWLCLGVVQSIRATEEEKEAEAYKAALSEVHLQAAQRLLRVGMRWWWW